MKACDIVRHKLTGEEMMVLSQEGLGMHAYSQKILVRMKDYSAKFFEEAELEPVTRWTGADPASDLIFELYENDKLVGYEMWSKDFRWNYSPARVMGARGWSGAYIYHDAKLRIEEIPT